MKIVLMLTSIATIISGGANVMLEQDATPETIQAPGVVAVDSEISRPSKTPKSIWKEKSLQEETPTANQIENLEASEREITCLASAIHYEARGEVREGQIAVAEVVIARAESDIYPDDMCDVISQRAQFSFVRRGEIPPVPNRDLEERTTMARQVVAGELKSKVRGAMYFHAGYVAPSWRHQMKRIAQIGGHIFYRRHEA